jgi:hypothetical protein
MFKCKALGLALGAVCLLDAAAQQQVAKKGQEAFQFNFKPVEIEEGADELRRLIVERYNAAGKDLMFRVELYRGGRTSLEFTLGALERFAKAGVELAESPAQKVKQLETSLSVAISLEAIVAEKFKHEVEPVQALEHAKYARSDLQIQLHRAREAKAAAAR